MPKVHTRNETIEADRVYVKVSGWVNLHQGDHTLHIPPTQIIEIKGDVTYQSPQSGRV